MWLYMCEERWVVERTSSVRLWAVQQREWRCASNACFNVSRRMTGNRQAANNMRGDSDVEIGVVLYCNCNCRRRRRRRQPLASIVLGKTGSRRPN
jgi:hypothetical protein